MQCPFHGSYPALPTPLRNGEVDLDAWERLLRAHVKHQSRGVVICGTSGEAPTLERKERELLLARAVEVAGNDLQVIAGVGTHATRETVARAQTAERLGADGLLVVTPYYNRPGPSGLLAHYGALAEAVNLPIMLYNVPTRTGTDLTPRVVAELVRRHPHIVAIKEASARLERARELARIPGLSLFCGEDAMIGEFRRAGAAGAVSVSANLAPDAVARLVEEDRERSLERRLAPLARALFLESNPIPLKYALSRLGWCSGELRLPLTPLAARHRRTLDGLLTRLRPLIMQPPKSAQAR